MELAIGSCAAKRRRAKSFPIYWPASLRFETLFVARKGCLITAYPAVRSGEGLRRSANGRSDSNHADESRPEREECAARFPGCPAGPAGRRPAREDRSPVLPEPSPAFRCRLPWRERED